MAKKKQKQKKNRILLLLDNCGYSNLFLTTTTENLHPSELLPTLVSGVVFVLCPRENNCLDG